MTPSRPSASGGDAGLLAVVDATMAGAAKACGANLACRAGCTECCIGPFNISALDADRLRRGLDELARRDPARASAIRERAREACAAFAADFPGDPSTGFCELDTHRPIGCRTYGPPMRIESVDLPPCRLCFVDAPFGAIDACRTTLGSGALEDPLEEIARVAGWPAETLIGFALVRP